MFGKNTKDVSQTLSLMIDNAMRDCRSNQTAAIDQVTQHIRQDRRFDTFNAGELAKRAFYCKRSGKTLDLTEPYRTNSGGGSAVV